MNFAGLEQAFNEPVKNASVEVLRGFNGGGVDHEDGFPWFEVSGNVAEDEFCQNLATAMRCRVLLNSTGDEGVICGVMDFDEKNAGPGGVLPAISDSDIDGYGNPFYPKIRKPESQSSQNSVAGKSFGV